MQMLHVCVLQYACLAHLHKSALQMTIQPEIGHGSVHLRGLEQYISQFQVAVKDVHFVQIRHPQGDVQESSTDHGHDGIMSPRTAVNMKHAICDT